MSILSRDIVKIGKEEFAKACVLDIALELVSTSLDSVFVRANRYALREMTRNGLSFSYDLRDKTTRS